MRLWKATALTTLAAASLASGLASPISPATTSPASADPFVHEITMGGSVRVRDDEVINRRNKTCTHAIDARGDAQLPSRSTILLQDTNNKCGGEVRVEFHVSATLRQDAAGNPSWCASGVAELYEGTSDTSNDRDGSRSLPQQCGVPGQTLVWDDIVHNTAEGGDWGDYLVEVQLF
jgi:hypothetical protein